MKASHRLASPADAKTVQTVRALAAQDLTTRFGRGHWSSVSTVATLKRHALASQLHVVELDDEIVGTFTLNARKIPFYRKSWFANPDDSALYLTNMAVRPDMQRRGIGRWVMARIEELAREQRCGAVRFDAYDAPAGAGAFYQKCGYVCVHRGRIGQTALEYYEKVL
jgi:GNAT superfamily N-acetyltransferase